MLDYKGLFFCSNVPVFLEGMAWPEKDLLEQDQSGKCSPPLTKNTPSSHTLPKNTGTLEHHKKPLLLLLSFKKIIYINQRLTPFFSASNLHTYCSGKSEHDQNTGTIPN